MSKTTPNVINVPVQVPTTPTQVIVYEPKSICCEILTNGLPNSWWAPGLKTTFHNVCFYLTEWKTEDHPFLFLYPKNYLWPDDTSQSNGLWCHCCCCIWCPMSMQMTNTKKCIVNMCRRPHEIWTTECDDIYNYYCKDAVRKAHNVSSGIQQRLYLLSGRVKGGIVCFVKKVFQIPVVFIWHFLGAILCACWELPIPLILSAGSFVIGILICIFRPIIYFGRFIQSLLFTIGASCAMGILDKCLPEFPIIANDVETPVPPDRTRTDDGPNQIFDGGIAR